MDDMMLWVAVGAVFASAFLLVAAVLWPRVGKHSAPNAYNVFVTESSGHPEQTAAAVREAMRSELRSV